MQFSFRFLEWIPPSTQKILQWFLKTYVYKNWKWKSYENKGTPNIGVNYIYIHNECILIYDWYYKNASYMHHHFCRFAVAVGYYGLLLSMTGLAGNQYLNFFISGSVDLVAFILVVFIVKL